MTSTMSSPRTQLGGVGWVATFYSYHNHLQANEGKIKANFYPIYRLFTDQHKQCFNENTDFIENAKCP